jgi:DNA ligase-1
MSELSVNRVFEKLRVLETEMIKRPMKALGEPISDKDLRLLPYPVIGSPKIDGIRAITTGSKVLSATLKPIGNRYIQKCLSHSIYEGLDGELAVGKPYIDLNDDPDDDVFHRTSGPVRRADGEPDFKFYVFDDWTEPKRDYIYRWISQYDYLVKSEMPHVVILEYKVLNNPQEVLDYEEWCVNMGYEGCMLRIPSSPYKEGRTTFKEMFAFKRKPIEDDEAEIVGFFEQMENNNEQVTDVMGLSRRSAHKENKTGKDTLGGFVLKSTKFEDTFRCGTIIGGTKEWRKTVWDLMANYGCAFESRIVNGKVEYIITDWKAFPKELFAYIESTTVKYKFQRIGSIDKPRQPRMKGFRDKSDMTKF